MKCNEVLKQMTNLCNSFFEQYDQNVIQKKDSTLSSQIRKKGNEWYSKKSHIKRMHQLILQSYTKSIAFAVENSEEQALGYSNRSALLMHLQKYQECLFDIGRASKITESENLKKKLLLRKEKCLNFITNKIENLNSEPNSTQSCSKIENDLVFNEIFKGVIPNIEISDAINKKVVKRRPTLESPNKTISSFSESLSLNYNKEYGRHVVATKDIEPGEIVVVEKGFVFPDINKIYLVCSHCLNITWNGIPCPNCVYAIYCSEKCKDQAWQEYHDIECSILPPFLAINTLEHTKMSIQLLAVRVLIMFVKSEGLDSIIDQAKSIDNDKSNNLLLTKFFSSY